MLYEVITPVLCLFRGGRRVDPVTGADISGIAFCRGAGNAQGRQRCLGYRRYYQTLERGGSYNFV